MKMDITKRIEWLSKRVNLTEQDKEYVRFVMVEAVTDAVKQVNKTNDIHDVSNICQCSSPVFKTYEYTNKPVCTKCRKI